MEFFGIGFFEIVVVLIIGLLLIGPDKIVEVAKTLGRISRTLKKASSDLSAQITRELEEEKKGKNPPSGPRMNA
jgi:Sec-independent protein translocase protein TatA